MSTSIFNFWWKWLESNQQMLNYQLSAWPLGFTSLISRMVRETTNFSHLDILRMFNITCVNILGRPDALKFFLSDYL